MEMKRLKEQDPEIYEIIKDEEARQQNKLSMIASENFTSPAIREALGSVLTHKYSEGYPGARYYEGNVNIDKLELLTIERAKKVFTLPEDWSANVQPLSGSPANLAVMLGLLKPGDTIFGMYLADGGHLSHGWSYEPNSEEQNPNDMFYKGGSRKVNVTSKIFKAFQYKTDPKTKQFDWDAVEKMAEEIKPQLIITGGTAYPREINYARVKQIAEKVGAYYLADIAHEAGLIAAGVNSSPVGIADVVTFTTHKTLRCNRGAMILARQDLLKKINRAIFPGLQGGPHNHSMAGICVGLGEAMTPQFKEYAAQIVKNAQTLANELMKLGFSVITSGTDKHLILIDLTNKGVFGKKFARALDYAGIVANMNTMPQEVRPPSDPSGLRIGTSWITTRGIKEDEMALIASFYNRTMNTIQKWNDLDFAAFEEQVKASPEIAEIASDVKKLCAKYPLAI